MSGDYKAKWELLLGDDRFRPRSPKIKEDARDPYEDDYGRLVSSAEIRRLQGKTQVFPMPESGYPRTRLTHSMEVSFFAGSIGKSIEKVIIEKNDFPKGKDGHLASLLRVAGLVHDLGNTPFGHFGEKAIQDFFFDYFQQTTTALSPQQVKDLVFFDGNVQTFRVLSKLHFLKDRYAFNLTCQTLSAIIKYPCSSLDGNEQGNLERKKFGFFESESEEFKYIDEKLHLNGHRNPITYIVEAADDLAFRAADIEDGVRLGVLSIEDIHEILEEKLVKNKDLVLGKFDSLINDYSFIKKRFPELYKMSVIQNLRIFNQQLLIRGAINSFNNYYDSIMNGSFNQELLVVSDYSDILDACRAIFVRILNDKKVLRLETAGYTAIRGLLDLFIPAILGDKHGSASFNQHIYELISQEYRYYFESGEKTEYSGLQLAVDYVSGMTDEYAIDLYQRLSGIRI